MKKFLMVALLAASSMVANAQWYAGGTVGFSSLKPEGVDAKTTLTLSPEIGYQVNDKMAVGVEVEYVSVKDASDDFGLKPYVRWTLAAAGNVKFFVDGQVGFVSHKENGWKDATNKFGLWVNPGLSLDLGKKVSLIAKTNLFRFVSQSENKSDVKNGGASTDFGLNVKTAPLEFGAIVKL